MRVLILDDIQERHDAFGKLHEADECVHAYTHEQACDALLNQEPFDLAYLDHDLADFQSTGYMGNEERTGTDVCVFLVRFVDKDRRPERVVIHSWNPDGARRMRRILQDAGVSAVCRPFDGGGIELG